MGNLAEEIDNRPATREEIERFAQWTKTREAARVLDDLLRLAAEESEAMRRTHYIDPELLALRFTN